MKKHGATMLAISPMTPASTAEMKQALESPFPILSDGGNEVARTFGLVHVLPEYLRPVYEQFGIDLPKANGDQTFELPLPATYVIDQDGTIRFAHVELDYTQRAEPRDILAALAKLSP